MEIAPEDIIITCGAMEAINLSLNAVAKPGDIIAIETPTFYSTLLSIQRLGMKVVEISLGNALNALVAGPSSFVRISEMLGALMPIEKKRELVAMLAKANIPLIEDDVYAELYFGKARSQPAKSFDRSGLVFALWAPLPKVLRQGPASGGSPPAV